MIHKSIGNGRGIGGCLRHALQGENFIRHVEDKLIFTFDEGSGNTVHDKSHCGNDGTFGAGVAAPTWKRNSLYFDGGDNINCGSDTTLDITDTITVEAFVKFDSLTNHDMIISKTSLAALNVGWGINYFNSAIRFFINTWDNNFGALSFTDTKNWNFIVGTYDKNAGSNEINININNVLGTPDTLSDDITGELTDVVIGEGFGSNFIDGYIKNIRICNRILSQIEIQQEYLASKFSNN